VHYDALLERDHKHPFLYRFMIGQNLFRGTSSTVRGEKPGDVQAGSRF
jgi:hypothetical protein